MATVWARLDEAERARLPKGVRVQLVDGRRVFWLDKIRGGTRYLKRLGAISADQAGAEVSRFLEAPEAYRTPDERREDERVAAEEAHLDAAAEAKAREATAVRLDEETIAAFIEAYRTRVTPHQAFVVDAYLAQWATSPALFGKDLRRVELRDLAAELSGKKSVKARIVALKAFTAWLREQGRLKRAEDPTLDLKVPQPRRPTPRELAERVYDVRTIEATYRHIPNQAVRDLYFAKVHSGMHESEIRRIASGDAVVRKLKGQGAIAATVDFEHRKKGGGHRQSIDRATLARLERLVERTRRDGWPTEKTIARNLDKAAEGSSKEAKKPVERVYLANLRATRTTLLQSIGKVVHPKGAKGGVPLELVARSHGHDPRTAAAFYTGTEIPPMLVLPVKLVHPEDPEVKGGKSGA